jgi:hypothetical protein
MRGLTNEEFEILDHTLHRAARNRYCGDSPAMQKLVNARYMQSLGKAAWCPDEYFTITDAGRAAHDDAVARRAAAK